MTLTEQGWGGAGPLLLLKLQQDSLRSAGHLAGVHGALRRALGDPDYNLVVVTLLLEALTRAIHAWRDQALWNAIQRTGMAQDFSWDRGTGSYLSLFKTLRRPK